MDVEPKAFAAVHKINTLDLQNLSNEEIRPLLPCLARIAFYKFEVSPVNEIERNTILDIIERHEDINSIISLMSYDFQAMELDLRKELEQRRVYRTNLNDLKSSINENTIISLDFSRNENFCRYRLIINELLQMQELTMLISTGQLKETFYKSELFELDVYINEISDVICCAMYELPETLRLLDIVESLLFVKMGPKLICRIAANFSEHFEEICMSLLRNSKQTESEESLISKIRTSVLRTLCRMNPTCVSNVRAAAIEMNKMPALCLQLSLDHMEIFHDNEQNKSARYLNDLVQFVRNILLSNESDAKSWLKDGQKHVDLLEEKILNHSDQNKNEMLYEPVYTLACQVYNRINDLFDLSDDRIESNKELLLMFAHVFTLFNSTLSEKFKFQHEMEDFKDRFKQQQFLNTRERENVNRLKEKLEEYEAQNHEDIQKYESEIGHLESKIKNLEKDKRKFEYEIEDNLKELKHTHDSVVKLFNLIEEYGSSDEYGITQFFSAFQTFVNNIDFKQSLDKNKIINQLNNCLEKKLIDVKNEVLRLQEEKILTKIKNSEDRINKIFENGTNNFMKNDFVFQPLNMHEIESTNLTLQDDYDDEQSYDFEDDLTERIKQLKKINQANIDRITCVEKTDDDNQMSKETESSSEQVAQMILNSLIDEYIQQEIKEINIELREENKAKMTDILNTGLVKVNSNNEIVANKSNSNLSQAKLMLINENNSTNEEHMNFFQEEFYNRFEKSLAEIITHSVNQSELSSPEEGETLQSILDSKHNSLSDSMNDLQRQMNGVQTNINGDHSCESNESSDYDKSSNGNSPNQMNSNDNINYKIVEILEELVKYDVCNEIIDKDKLMQKSILSPKRQTKSIMQLTPEKRATMNGIGNSHLNKKDAFTNTDLIATKNYATLTDNLSRQTVSISTEPIVTKTIEINTNNNSVRTVSTCTEKCRTEHKNCSTKKLTTDVALECNLVNYEDCSTSTGFNLNDKSIAIHCDLMSYQDVSTHIVSPEQSKSEKATIIHSNKTQYRILTRTSRLMKLKKIFRRLKRNSKKNHLIKRRSKSSHSDQEHLHHINNNYLNGFDPKLNGKSRTNTDSFATTNHITSERRSFTENHCSTDHSLLQSTKLDYDFVFCHHVPPFVSFLITFLFFFVSFMLKMVKNFILLFVCVFFLLRIIFCIWPPPHYLSWQDILLSFLEPHITVHHYN